MDNKRPYNTVNSFTRKPCINQIISYLIIVADNITFWLLIQNNYANQYCRFTMIALFACSVLIMLTFGCLTSSYDPSDPIMTEYRNGNVAVIQGKQALCLYCDHCKSYVYKTSRHCKLCDRCVDKFDHHCIWINNCIGKNNYRVFMGMIISAEAHLFIYLTAVLLLWTQNNWKDYMLSMIITWIVFSAALIFSLLLLALIILHFFLIYRDITTYEYMVSKKNAQIIPKPQKQLVSTTQLQTASPNKTDLYNKSEQANRTSNYLPAISAFKHVQKEDDRYSAFRQINPFMAQSKVGSNRTDQERSMSDFEQIKKPSVDQHQNQGFEDFYKTHHGLKLLLGNGVTIKSKNTNSCRQIKHQQCFGKSISESSEEKNSQHQQKVQQKFQKVAIIFDNDL